MNWYRNMMFRMRQKKYRGPLHSQNSEKELISLSSIDDFLEEIEEYLSEEMDRFFPLEKPKKSNKKKKSSHKRGKGL